MADMTLMNKYPKDVAVFSDPQEGVKQGYQLLEVLGVVEDRMVHPGVLMVGTKIKFLMGRDVDENSIIATYSKNYQAQIEGLTSRLEDRDEKLCEARKEAETTKSSLASCENQLESLKKLNRGLRTQIAGLKKQLEGFETLDGEAEAATDDDRS